MGLYWSISKRHEKTDEIFIERRDPCSLPKAWICLVRRESKRGLQKHLKPVVWASWRGKPRKSWDEKRYELTTTPGPRNAIFTKAEESNYSLLNWHDLVGDTPQGIFFGESFDRVVVPPADHRGVRRTNLLSSPSPGQPSWLGEVAELGTSLRWFIGGSRSKIQDMWNALKGFEMIHSHPGHCCMHPYSYLLSEPPLYCVTMLHRCSCIFKQWTFLFVTSFLLGWSIPLEISGIKWVGTCPA